LGPAVSALPTFTGCSGSFTQREGQRRPVRLMHSHARPFLEHVLRIISQLRGTAAFDGDGIVAPRAAELWRKRNDPKA
jgi:hypothetical protein